MGALIPQRRNKIKKLNAIKELESKGGDLNADQAKKIASKGDIEAEIETLNYYINLYEKAQPKWNAAPEEVKVEETKEEPVSEELIN